MITHNGKGGHVAWMAPVRTANRADLLTVGRATGIQRLAGRPGENTVVNQRAAILGGALTHGYPEADVVAAFDDGDIERAAALNADRLDRYNSEVYWNACLRGLDWQSRGGTYAMPPSVLECRLAAMAVDAAKTARVEELSAWVRRVGTGARFATLGVCGYLGAAAALQLIEPRSRTAVSLTMSTGALSGLGMGLLPAALMRKAVCRAFGAVALAVAV
jgi:hypothetical protein